MYKLVYVYAARTYCQPTYPNRQVLHVQWRGKELWGILEVLPTPSGLLLRDLYSRGIKLGVSSRSWASLVRGRRGVCEVGDDMELITFDFVVDPSNSGAFLVPLARRYRWAGWRLFVLFILVPWSSLS